MVALMAANDSVCMRGSEYVAILQYEIYELINFTNGVLFVKILR